MTEVRFEDYFREVGITELFLDRARAVLAFYAGIGVEEVMDVFVSEYVDAEGRRVYESLWLFTLDYAYEAKDFLTADNFDGAPLPGRIEYWKITKTEYDFQTTFDRSRMALEFLFLGGYNKCSLKASASNCSHLRDIFRRHVLPNLSVAVGTGR